MSASCDDIDPRVVDTVVITIVRDGDGRTVANIGDLDPHHALGMLVAAVEAVKRHMPDVILATTDGEILDIEVDLDDEG